MRLMTKSIFISIAFLILGCGKITSSQPDLGSFSGREYRNDMLGFSLDVPVTWTIADENERKLAQEIALEQLYGNPELHPVLFFLYRNPQDTRHTTIYAYAANLKSLNGISTAEDYLHRLADMMGSDNPRITSGEVYTGEVGGKTFKAMGISASFASETVKPVSQYLYATLLDEHALGFSITYSTANELAAARNVIQRLHFFND